MQSVMSQYKAILTTHLKLKRSALLIKPWFGRVKEIKYDNTMMILYEEKLLFLTQVGFL